MSWYLLALSVSFVLVSGTTWNGEPEEPASEVAAPTRTGDQAYRLPQNVIPLEYDVYIDLYFNEADKPFSFEGREIIWIRALEDVTEIVLHANVDSIDNVTLFSETGTNVPINRYTTEPQYHFLRISLDAPLVVDSPYALYISYTSTMNEGPMERGIWRGWYVDEDGNDRIYATTHFQPYNTRQAFPCWDEPMFKAEFTLHLSKPASYLRTFTNTVLNFSEPIENGRVRDHFQTTPQMSSYLVTFLVSETFTVLAEDRSFEPPIRIIGRSNAVGQADQALELAVRMTEHFQDYFDIPYASLHRNLNNDHVASPDWASAGTENWGMVSYRELHIMINRSETIMSVEHYGATLVSHELAHKWFGNLITCLWWSETWINEGYASYFGYMATHEMFPQYEMHEHFNSRYLQTSLSYDSGVATTPMNYEVNTPAQVTSNFGTISYSKGAAFLRMTANMITMDTFRKSCQYFLKNNLYQPTDQHDLLEAFNQAVTEDGTLNEYQNFNFTQYYDVWVNQPGYPILIVTVNHTNGEMALRQERFFVSATAQQTGQVYPIPITYSTRRSSNFANLKPTDMMSNARMVLQKEPGEEWVIFNHQQQAHYRVTYDVNTWRLIARALQDERETIHHLNRAQIVDDVFALMRSQRMTYELGFEILRFLRSEDNYHVWNPAITGFTWIRNRIRHLSESLAEFDSIILGYMQTVIARVGYEPTAGETSTVSLLRQEVLQFACNLGHEGCIRESVRQFVSMRDNTGSVDRRIRRQAYMNGIREGGSQDFDFLLNRFLSSNLANDRLEMLRGLGSTTNAGLLSSYLQLTLTREVRSHDKATAFSYALLGHRENANTVLEFVMNNFDAIRREYVENAPPRPVNTILTNLASNLDEAGLVEYENWLRTTQSNITQFSTAISAINSARNNIAWGNNNVDLILSAARDGAVASTVSLLLVLAAVTLAAVV